jgi:hypothetical protein
MAENAVGACVAARSRAIRANRLIGQQHIGAPPRRHLGFGTAAHLNFRMPRSNCMLITWGLRLHCGRSRSGPPHRRTMRATLD